MSIHQDPTFKRMIDTLDEHVRELHRYVQDWANTHDDDWIERESALVFGWVMGVGITGYSEGDETDDVLMLSSPSLNSYTALGMVDQLHWNVRQEALGIGDE